MSNAKNPSTVFGVLTIPATPVSILVSNIPYPCEAPIVQEHDVGVVRYKKRNQTANMTTTADFARTALQSYYQYLPLVE
jgi:hypothetical protein